MKQFGLQVLRTRVCIAFVLLSVNFLHAQTFQLQTKYAMIMVDDKGSIVSIKDKKTGQEYCPKGMSSALMSLYNHKQYILPKKAVYNAAKHEFTLTYDNGSEARIKAEQKQQYLRFQLLSLTSRTEVDNIVWGPYKTTISKTIGDVIGVVRNNDLLRLAVPLIVGF